MHCLRSGVFVGASHVSRPSQILLAAYHLLSWWAGTRSVLHPCFQGCCLSTSRAPQLSLTAQHTLALHGVCAAGRAWFACTKSLAGCSQQQQGSAAQQACLLSRLLLVPPTVLSLRVGLLLNFAAGPSCNLNVCMYAVAGQHVDLFMGLAFDHSCRCAMTMPLLVLQDVRCVPIGRCAMP
jgi:hypothetical protein